MNPIINQMFANGLGGFFDMFRIVKSSQNKDALMQSLAQRNPQVGQILNFIQRNGGDAKQLYYSSCQQNGVDPNLIINQLRNI